MVALFGEEWRCIVKRTQEPKQRVSGKIADLYRVSDAS